MSRTDGRGTWDLAMIVVGGGLGALIRYLIFVCWPAPLEVLATTLLSVFVAFLVLGIVLATQAGPLIRAFVAGLAGAIGSVGAYTAIGINEPPLPAVSTLVLVPAALLLGLVGGSIVGVMVGGRRGSSESAP